MSEKLRSRRLSFKDSLEVITNISVSLVAVLILGSFAWHYVVMKRTSNFSSGLKKGETVSRLAGYDYWSTPQTVILALSTKCSYCAASTPFFQRLTQIERDNSGRIHIVAVFPESKDAVDRYISEKQLNIDTIAGADFRNLKVTATPTLILVDSNGKVRDFWIGKLTDDGESNVIKAIGAARV